MNAGRAVFRARKRRTGGWLILAALVVALDQIAKAAITARYPLGGGERITGFFNLVRWHNQGAAFSFLAGAGGWQRWFLTALAIAACALIAWLLRIHAANRLFCGGLALILGGAIGNVIDRIWHGYVIDFLDFHWSFLAPLFQGGHFPAFNLADSAITIGAVLVIVNELRQLRQA
ncbi:MAG: signal peptidase II [Burkholderiaceae bacterium]|jgi:signal peptidase II|nr:signal peptidase II [Burkholderiaceae bacterium]